jgi:hypothetical protein
MLTNLLLGLGSVKEIRMGSRFSQVLDKSTQRKITTPHGTLGLEPSLGSGLQRSAFDFAVSRDRQQLRARFENRDVALPATGLNLKTEFLRELPSRGEDRR